MDASNADFDIQVSRNIQYIDDVLKNMNDDAADGLLES